MTGWQPIETAPEDGRQVIVYGGTVLGEKVEMRGADGGWWRLCKKQGYHSIPTHWMPLPEPPK